MGISPLPPNSENSGKQWNHQLGPKDWPTDQTGDQGPAVAVGLVIRLVSLGLYKKANEWRWIDLQTTPGISRIQQPSERLALACALL